MTTIDFKKLYGEAGKITPEGEYDVIWVKAEAVTSSNGKPMVKASAVIETGPMKDRYLYTQFVLSVENQTALQIFFRQMALFGMNDAFWDDNPPMDRVASMIPGKRTRVVVVHREWKGQMRTDIDSIKPGQVTGPIPEGLVKGSSGGGSSAPPVPTAPQAPTTPPPAPSSDAPPLPAF